MATKNVSFCVKKGENWNCSPRPVLGPHHTQSSADSQLSEQGHEGQTCLLCGYSMFGVWLVC